MKNGATGAQSANNPLISDEKSYPEIFGTPTKPGVCSVCGRILQRLRTDPEGLVRLHRYCSPTSGQKRFAWRTNDDRHEPGSADHEGSGLE